MEIEYMVKWLFRSEEKRFNQLEQLASCLGGKKPVLHFIPHSEIGLRWINYLNVKEAHEKKKKKKKKPMKLLEENMNKNV